MNHYEEICKPVGARQPKYPEACPVCGARIKDAYHSEYQGPIYECGGLFRLKPQLQHHTNKWWGYCPKTYMEELESKKLLDSHTTLWVVYADGNRKHIASFSMGCVSETFARDFSKSYPRFWDDVNPVAYMELVGGLGPYGGKRFCNGHLIAVKKFPNCTVEVDEYKRKWYAVEEKNLWTYIIGSCLED